MTIKPESIVFKVEIKKQGSIRTVVGQANLVMRERGKQFESLIHSHEFGTSEKVINSSDLQGFWDMIYFQV